MGIADMTIEGWKIYFRVGYILTLLPFVEMFAFGTGWSTIAAFAYLGPAVFTIRCRNCGLAGTDHRIATHFKGVETLEKCPHCGEPMVPTS